MAAYRLINPDGSFNVARKGTTFRPRDLYHSLLVLGWRTFFALLAGSFVVANLVFAVLYLACGPGALGGSTATTTAGRFEEAFFFSVHTLATIGYGNLFPNGFLPNILVTIEAFSGLIGLAVATGLVFARFSRPTARVIFSNRALIVPHDGVPSFMFRIANLRLNQIAEARVAVAFARDESTAEGIRYRTYTELELERSRNPIFALTWLVVHPITSSSPLFGMSYDALNECSAEIVVTLSGIDDTLAQSIHSRYSYVPGDIIWNREFADMVSRGDDGKVSVNLGAIHSLMDEVRGQA